VFLILGLAIKIISDNFEVKMVNFRLYCGGLEKHEVEFTKIDDLKKELAEFKGQAGLTFCGGEPFVQPKACKEIADYVRNDLGWNVWSFSGFTYEIIKESGGEAWEFLKSLDALIDGPFILSQRDLSLRFRGSKNQRLLRLKLGTGEILAIE
jgi:organic radical activating enzyme